ncbi:DUF5625 family protein [Methylobacterium sp. WL19]|uniref:DUF5625 family protein n=1 Tax=Methylobacterium sp. WL19 TaxID=2603896 RepID=UPI0011C9433D|nr:DUF5625 family protein [Methylobacterium sp. WL19]TXN25660.1 hypothetical protein FV220_17835 [Methylobacterium sp. WL19]
MMVANMKCHPFRIYIVVLGALACANAPTNAAEFDSKEVPFQAGIKSSQAEFIFNVWKKASHSFYLNLYFNLGSRDDPDRNKDRDRVRKLAGHGGYNITTKRRIDNGLAIPVRLKIVRLDDKNNGLILDEAYDDPIGDGFTDKYYAKLILRYILEPGIYKARIEALKDLPSLQTVPVKFDVHVAHDRS